MSLALDTSINNIGRLRRSLVEKRFRSVLPPSSRRTLRRGRRIWLEAAKSAPYLVAQRTYWAPTHQQDAAHRPASRCVGDHSSTRAPPIGAIESRNCGQVRYGRVPILVDRRFEALPRARHAAISRAPDHARFPLREMKLRVVASTLRIGDQWVLTDVLS